MKNIFSAPSFFIFSQKIVLFKNILLLLRLEDWLVNMIMDYFNKQNRYCALLATFTILIVTHLNAQQKRTTGLSPEVMAWTISTIEPWPQDKYKTLKEAMIDNKIFIPLVFRGGLFNEIGFKYSRDSLRLNDGPPLSSPYEYKSKNMGPMFSHYKFLKSLEDSVYKNVMLPNPLLFKYSYQQLPTTVIKSEAIETSKDFIKLNVKTVVTPPKEVDPVIKFIPDRKYWTSTFAADVKFSRTKTSVNWHKGEINNTNIYTFTNTTYNYARDNVTMNNTLTTKFTIINAPKDTVRDYTIGDDELRLRSVLGLKAIKLWSYSFSAEFFTSMGNKYMPNVQTINASFLSPFTFTTGLGMTYMVKPKFKKPDRSLDLSLTLDPLSFMYKASKNKDINLINLAAHFQKDENGNQLHKMNAFGSTINLTQTFRFSKSITLASRFYYFTNYKLVNSEFENKLDIILSKYFSTTLHLFLRYDDKVKKAEGSDTYLQVFDMLAFGFSYKW